MKAKKVSFKRTILCMFHVHRLSFLCGCNPFPLKNNKLKLAFILLLVFIVICPKVQVKSESIKNQFSFTGGEGTNGKVAANGTHEYVIQPHFQFLNFGEVKPEGWIKEQMVRDLQDGFAGCLNKLSKEAATDIFVSGRNSSENENIINGALNPWWNGGTEGNWWTGFIMLAYLSGNKLAMGQADSFADHVLESQDENGYLGIYSGNLQYTQKGDLCDKTIENLNKQQE